MKQILLMIAVVMGQSMLAADKKPLTKEESAKFIEAVIRRSLNKPTGELTKAGLEKVTMLNLDFKQLTNVKGLEKLTQLKGLNLADNQITDLSALETLTQLKYLRLSDNQLTDVKGLEKLTQLKYLNLEDNQLTDVKGLEKLTQLNELNLKNKFLFLDGNPVLTKAQIAELQKALPKCDIYSNAKK